MSHVGMSSVEVAIEKLQQVFRGGLEQMPGVGGFLDTGAKITHAASVEMGRRFVHRINEMLPSRDAIV